MRRKALFRRNTDVLRNVPGILWFLSRCIKPARRTGQAGVNDASAFFSESWALPQIAMYREIP